MASIFLVMTLLFQNVFQIVTSFFITFTNFSQDYNSIIFLPLLFSLPTLSYIPQNFSSSTWIVLLLIVIECLHILKYNLLSTYNVASMYDIQ